MNVLSMGEIAQIVGGEIRGPANAGFHEIAQIATDSRTYFNGGNTLFFALKGPRNNGHRYVAELAKRGAKNFVVSEADTDTESAGFIVVENTLDALQKLAAFNRRKFAGTVVGITGSNGKTIIKEWLHDILSQEFSIVRNPKSYNSQVGVPLSVLLMDANYNLGIFEAGISQPGEMQKLSSIISPEIGILTNIGDAHQENFSSLEEKINEKLFLFAGSKTLIFNADNQQVKNMAADFCEKKSVKPLSWSLQNKAADLQFVAQIKETSTQILTECGKGKYQFSIPFTDRSSLENACHCFAASIVLLDKPEKTAQKFNRLETVEMRLEIKQGINQCLLVNDYYNSDLNSLGIAFSVLHQQAAKAHLRKQVILSDIQETGMAQKVLYRRVADLLSQWKIDELIGIGPEISQHPDLFSIDKTLYASRTDFEKHFDRNNFHSAAILIKGARQFAFENISALLQQKSHQTQLEINLDSLVDNLNVFKSLLSPNTKIMAMVKAFSYGSGDVEIAKTLQHQNIDYLAVAVTDEGVHLRNHGINTPILVMNPERHSFQQIIDYGLEPNIYSIGLLDDFLAATEPFGLVDFPVHLKLDTGMNRLGLKTEAEINKAAEMILASRRLQLKSVFSHLSASDEEGFDPFTRDQFIAFEKMCKQLSVRFGNKIYRHILNSAGIERFPEKQFEMVRLGIGLYGISAQNMPLQPIGSLVSTVSQVKAVERDETVGYGRKGKIAGPGKIAIVPLGYADGLDRKLGNGNGEAFVMGKRVPIIGNICMDMLMLDVTGLAVKPGDRVEFFGPNISISEVAEKAGTIAYEILTGISQRVKRVYLQA